ncbi:hypothetical protein MBEHAL_0495 [Halarchaeum acidiphilum MH1-52-1]|uniref:Rubredoxin-like domain-containing protein n=1 Tax=Halarchaeum acidiphilum MH1-52-1 TaxID=1261545 RepID=U2YRW2_9EURY|nr:hypothetical protein [Halarchaeum acidiphilum]GAD51735.1 hypothetical protein MBEHAL_0495 [Halarchaeum acidiphilum MH1-52-1]
MATITHLATRLLSDPTDHPFECKLCGQGYDSPRENCPACGSLNVESV